MVYIWGKWFQYQKMKGKPRKSHFCLYKELRKKGVALRRLFPNEFWLEIFYGVYWYPGATHEHCFLLIWLKKWFIWVLHWYHVSKKGQTIGSKQNLQRITFSANDANSIASSRPFISTRKSKGQGQCLEKSTCNTLWLFVNYENWRRLLSRSLHVPRFIESGLKMFRRATIKTAVQPRTTVKAGEIRRYMTVYVRRTPRVTFTT